MAVMNEYDSTFINRVQLMDLVNDRMPTAAIGFAFGVTVVNGSDSVHLKSTRRIALVIRIMKNIEKACVDEENCVELSDT